LESLGFPGFPTYILWQLHFFVGGRFEMYGEKCNYVFVFIIILTGFVFAVDPANPPATMRVTVDKGGQTRTFSLDRQSVRGADFEIVLLDADGVTQTTIDPGPVRTYRGWCEEEPDSYVDATLLSNGDLRYHVFKGAVDDWWYDPPFETDEGAAAVNNLTDIGGTPIQPSGTAFPGAFFTAPAANLSSFYSDVYQADVGYDLLVEYVEAFNYSNWETYARKAENAISHYNAIYVRDALAEHKLGKVVVRQSDTGLDRSDTQWGIDWWYINAYWSTGDHPVLGTITPLFPEVDHHFVGMVGDVGGGVAFGCDYGGVDWAARSFNGWSGNGNWWHVARHEHGHNWGCGDCVEGCPGPDGSTVNSNNSVTLSRFSNPEVDQFMSCRSSSGVYLRNIGAYTYPVPPYANLDEIIMLATDSYVDIDVLGNDYDANGDDIAIEDFETTTQLGGLVAFSAGTGPGGRDELVYVPPGDQLGTDRFTYTIVDDTGRESKGNIIIYLEPDDSLRGYWKLDETTGTTAVDSSAFGNNGSLNKDDAAPEWSFDTSSVSGQFDGGLELNGPADENYIAVSGLNFSSNTVTITAWIKRNGNQNSYAAIVSNRSGEAANFNFISNNKLGYHWNNSHWTWDSGLTVPNAQWVFVALVIKPTGATIYMDNGTLQSATNTTSLSPDSFYGTTYIGRGANGGDRYFKGAMDDVRIYNYAMNSSEIQAVRDGGGAENPSPFDDATNVENSLLNWAAGAAAVEHDIYLGTDETAVTNATQASPEYKGTTTLAGYPPTLSSLTQYYWRIDTVTASTTLTGSVWTFTTADQLTSISNDIITHLTMDSADISGSTITDFSGAPQYDGTIIDSSGNPAGQINEALTLDGVNDHATIPAMNLNSNTVTISAWIKRNGTQSGWAGIVFSRSASTVAGINFGEAHELRYHWNDGYWAWNSGLVVPNAQWSHIALVMEPDKATMYLNGTSATNWTGHGIEEFNGLTRIGKDQSGRLFKGDIDDVAIWNRSLSSAEINYIYQKGLEGEIFSHINLPPEFSSDPFTGPAAIEGVDYSESISLEASDPDGGTISYTKVVGPAWLDIATDGGLTGVPGDNNVGEGWFTVRATDDEGSFVQAQMSISVLNTYSGQFGLADFAGFAAHWQETGCVDMPPCSGADLSGNGDVDTEDLRIFAGNWIDVCMPVSCYVESIVPGTASGTLGREKCQTTVTIYDDCGNSLADATVTGTFTGPFTEQVIEVTDSDGVAVLTTTGQVTEPSFTFCVDEVTHAELTYEPTDNIETCDSY
jgi:hypothetical protein